MEDLQNMSSSLLLDGFRSLCLAIGSELDLEEKQWLVKKADKFEAEINRRMSW